MRTFILMIFVSASFSLLPQSEFPVFKNGLIYSEETMGKLSKIVDSLNLKYKSCDLNKVFYSKCQAVGHIIRLDTLNVSEAKKDIQNSISFEDFVKKYRFAKVERNALIVKFNYRNYEDKDIVEFSEVSLDGGYGTEIQKENKNNLYDKDMSGTWVMRYYDGNSYAGESVVAFYFPADFTSVPLNVKYCRQIGYADCLIDTVTTKFKKDRTEGWIDLPANWRKMSLQKQKELLDKMRSTRVVGGCSMDSRPREHAVNIALLSAQTADWEVFLKSHLDIMNDRFERVSDGSYAWGARQTYLKELEELEINVPDLLLGISLHVENPASNHYYGSIGRLGRAIAESKNKSEFVTLMINMIEDKDLDDYNRVIAFFLFRNFNHYLKNASEKEENISKLKSAISKLPDYLKEKISLE